LGDETGFGGAAEMAVVLERDEILQLLQGREVNRYSSFQSINSS